MTKLYEYLRPYKLQVFLGPLAKLFEAIFELITPLLMASLIDKGIKENNQGHIFNMFIFMAITTLLGFLCAIFCQYSASVASQGFGTNLRNELLHKINSFSYKEIDKFGTSTLTNRLISDINTLQLSVAMAIRLAVRAPFLSIGGIIMALRIDSKLSIILIIFIPIFLFFLVLIMKKTIPMYKKVQKKLDHILLILRENISGVRVIRAFNGSGKEYVKFESENEDYKNLASRASKISGLLSPLTFGIMNIATIFIIWYGSNRVYNGVLTQGELIAFTTYITQIMLALIVVSNLAVLFNKAIASSYRILEIFSTESSIKSGGVLENISENIIEFKNVSFGYTGKNVLENISFKINKGQTVGIIGGTGSGKSTLLNLIPRFYETEFGEIKIFNENIKNWNKDSLIKKIGFVPQKAVIFTGTIEDNISMGKNMEFDEIKKFSNIALADEFIEKSPDKYKTILFQSGKNLSGGQKQRITIARALAKNGEILILDDSSSALDYITDSKLRKNIKERINSTVIIASQRVLAVRDSDFILVMDEGKIKGIGNHEDLFSSNDLYRDICKSQGVTE